MNKIKGLFFILRNVNRDKTKKAIFLERNTLYKYER